MERGKEKKGKGEGGEKKNEKTKKGKNGPSHVVYPPYRHDLGQRKIQQNLKKERKKERKKLWLLLSKCLAY